jgi:hypothetical protein
MKTQKMYYCKFCGRGYPKRLIPTVKCFSDDCPGPDPRDPVKKKKLKLKLKRYSVLLLWEQEYGDGETYYAFIKATSPAEAVEKASLKAAKAWWGEQDGIDKDDLRERAKEFIPELVLNGWHKGLDFSK